MVRNPEYRYQPLSGTELAAQLDVGLAARANNLLQQYDATPRLEILSNHEEHLPSVRYMNLKQARGRKLGFAVNSHFTQTTAELSERIDELNADPQVHGIIVQLPLRDNEPFDEIVNTITPQKDVDGLTHMPTYDPATPKAILRLLAGNGFDYRGKRIALVGQGKLVGAPLYSMLQRQGSRHVHAIDEYTSPNARDYILNNAFIVISAVGKKVLDVSSFDDLTQTRVIIDAGTAEVKKTNGDSVIEGDMTDELRRALPANSYVSEPVGSVGPLTIRSLLENVVIAAETSVGE